MESRADWLMVLAALLVVLAALLLEGALSGSPSPSTPLPVAPRPSTVGR